METKLDQKYVAPYFLHELKVEHTDYCGTEPKVSIATIEMIGKDCITFKGNNCDYYFDDEEFDCDIKLLLHPLSDLTKPCLEGGKIPIIELVRQCHSCGSDYPLEFKKVKDKVFTIFKSTDTQINWTIGFNYMPHLQFHYVQKLFEWHFDVFGLIEAGLAIDINTLSAI